MPEPITLKRCQDARAIFGISSTTFYEWIGRGLMAPGVAIGARSVAWPDHELQAIAAARIAGKSEAEIKTLVQGLVKSRAGLLTTSFPPHPTPPAPAIPMNGALPHPSICKGKHHA